MTITKNDKHPYKYDFNKPDPNSLKHDSQRELKWAQPRVLRTELNRYDDPGIDFTGDPGKTDQSQSADCDINNIMRKYQQTGVLPGVNAQQMFLDVSDALTYHEALDLVLNAENQFMSLDAHTRKRFSNDPAEFMEFVHDPKNAEELVKMGLATLAPPSDTDRLVEAIKGSKTESIPPSPADPAPAGQAGPKK